MPVLASVIALDASPITEYRNLGHRTACRTLQRLIIFGLALPTKLDQQIEALAAWLRSKGLID